MLWNLWTYLFRRIGRQKILSPVRSTPLSVCNCDCIWPLTHIQKWIPAPLHSLNLFSLSLTHTRTYTYSDTHKEKDLEKEKIKTAPIWSIHHLSFPICHCKMGQKAHSYIHFSLFILILLLMLGWRQSGCAKGGPLFPFSVTPGKLSAPRSHQEMLFYGYMGNSEHLVGGVSQEKSRESVSHG